MPIPIDDTFKIITLSTDPASPPPAGYTYLYNLADGLYQMDSSGIVTALFNKKKSIVLSNNFNTNSVTRLNITEFVFPMIAGKKYIININGFIRSSVANRGVTMGFIVPTGTANIIGSLEISNSRSYTLLQGTVINAISSSNALAGSFLLSTDVNPVNVDHIIKADLLLTCLSSGTFQVQFGAENTGATATLVKDSLVTYEEL